MTAFSNATDNSGIVEQARVKAQVDSTQWSTKNIANSCNHWLNKIFTSGKSKDVNFQLDDSNHAKLPIGTTDLVANQSDYSFLTDEDGNRITNLTSVSLIEITTNKETLLTPIDRKSPTYDYASFGVDTGTPTSYDKIADNIIKLDKLPTAGDASKYKIKYYFQRTPSYFVSTDTTKEPGVSNDLHEGFIVKSAYDIAVSLGLPNINNLAAELQKEEMKLDMYLSTRNTDGKKRLVAKVENNH